MIARIRRNFSITALIGVVIAMILLTLLYGKMFENEIITAGEHNNLILARTALNNVKPELIGYLESVKKIIGGEKEIPPFPENLKRSLIEAMGDINAIRVNIYNQNGVIMFSTSPNKIGLNESTNKRFIHAINGRVASKLFYYDNLDFFGNEEERNEDANLIETYLPIRASNASTISGVIEIYTDVSNMIDQAEHVRVITILGVFVIMVMLYLFQLYFVRRAANVVAQQQDILQERSRTLEVLSAQLMNADESDRKRIANDLHEDVAQALSAAKMYLERASQIQSSSDAQTNNEPLEKTISILQDAIQDVRSLAMELRPTTLDEFGLIKTIDWLCQHFRELHHNIKLEVQIDVADEDIPAALNTIIYRVVKEGLASIGKLRQATRVQLQVSRRENNIVLTIEDNAVAYHADHHDRQSEQNIALATIKERVILSGGTFKLESNHQGGTIMTGEWPC